MDDFKPTISYQTTFDLPDTSDSLKFEDEEEIAQQQAALGTSVGSATMTYYDDSQCKIIQAASLPKLIEKLTLLRVFTDEQVEEGRGGSSVINSHLSVGGERDSFMRLDSARRDSAAALPPPPSSSSSSNLPLTNSSYSSNSTHILSPIPSSVSQREPPKQIIRSSRSVNSLPALMKNPASPRSGITDYNSSLNPLHNFSTSRQQKLAEILAKSSRARQEQEKERHLVRLKEQGNYWIGENDDDEKGDKDDGKLKLSSPGGSRLKRRPLKKGERETSSSSDKKKKEDKSLREKGYLDSFILTFDLYTKPRELLELLITRYLGPETPTDQFDEQKANIEVSVMYLIRRWIEFRLYNFVEDDMLASRLEEFILYIEPDVDIPSQKKLVSALLKCLMKLKKFPGETDSKYFDAHPPGSIENVKQTLTRPAFGFFLLTNKDGDDEEVPESPIPPEPVPLFKVDPQELANQITIIESKLIRSVRPHEFLKQAWSKSPKAAPRLVQAVEWFNRMSRWFSTEIAKEVSVEGRGATISLLMEVAQRCAILKNFNAITEILSSLHSSAVNNLKQSWALVPSKTVEEFDKIAKLMTPKANFKNYREAIKELHPPSVPYLGMYLKDLTFLDDCKPDYIGKLLNFDKIKTIGLVIRDIIMLQGSKYKLRSNGDWRNRILSAEVFDENSLFHISKLREEPNSAETISKKKGTKRGEYFSTLDITGQQTVSTKDSEMTQRDWQLLVTKASLVNFKRNDVIMEEGVFNQNLYRVKSGKVRVEKLQEGGQPPLVVAMLPEESMFGEMSVLDRHGKTTARIVAEDESVEIYMIDLNFLQTLFDTQDGLSRRFFQSLAKRLAKRLREKSASQVAPKAPAVTAKPAESDKKESLLQSAIAPPGKKNSMKKTDSQPRLRSSTGSRKEAETVDEKVNRKFSLSGSELIIKEYPAVLQLTIQHSGSLYILQSCVAFYARAFAVETKDFMPMTDIAKIERKGDQRLILHSKDGKKKINLKMQKNDQRDEVGNMIQSLMEKQGSTSSSSSSSSSSTASESTGFPKPILGEEKDEPTYEDPLGKEDWDLLLKGKKTVHYQKDEVIIQEGHFLQRLYQIEKGNCRIEKMKKDLGFKMKVGETFGEISFLEGGGAAVSVIADEATELHIIEGYFINILFDMRPGLAGRFFRYLCNVLAGRLVGKTK